MTLKHRFVSTILDDPAAVAAGEVVPSEWNDSHKLEGSTATPATLTAEGTDADISINLAPKGAGFVQFGPQTMGAGNLVCYTEAQNDAVPSGHVGHWVQSTLADVASGFAYGFSINAYTHGTGAVNDLNAIIGGNFFSASQLPTGRTCDLVIGQESIGNNLGTGTVNHAYGTYGTAVMNAVGGTIINAYGHKSLVASYSGTTTNGYGHYASYELDIGGSITNAYSYWSQALEGFATNPYHFWADEQGVYRIRADNTFDSVYQAIPASYNPLFAKYVAAAVNYERGVWQWTGNVWQITTEKGGTGTLRGMQIGASNSVPLGFYGVTPVARQLLATGAGHTVDDVIAALQALGLVKQS